MGYEKNLRKVVPYVPGEQPQNTNIIKLNTNENPYGPTPRVEEAIKTIKTDVDRMRLYPPVDAGILAKAISKYYGIDEKKLFIGVGSDDVLSVAFLTCFNSEKPVLFPNITYSFYDVWADLYKIPFEQLPLDENFKINREDYLKENGGIVIANPNAPTSLEMPLEDIEFIVKNNPDSVVIIDEAYVDFGAETALPLLDKYDNILVVQTFSKSRSMAGNRIGFCFGSEKIIKAMNDVKFSINSYTMNYPSIVLGCAAVEDVDYFNQQCAKIIKTREESAAELKNLGFKVLDSKTNFLFVSHEGVKAEKIFADLKNRGIYVRYFKKPIIDNYLRITIGTKAEMEALFAALEEIVK